MDSSLKDQQSWWPLSLAKPRELQRGSRIAIVTPSWGGPAVFPLRYEAGKRVLIETFGFQPVEMQHTLAPSDWIASNPAARAQDLLDAFADSSIDGIIAAIGGEDSVRLIPHLDLATLRDNPKVFLGYSDVTALHFACLKAGLVTFHGPTIMSGFAENGGISPSTKEAFRRVACQSPIAGELPWSQEGWAVERLDWADPANQTKPRNRTPSTGPRVLQGAGKARGRLIGGCAEVLEMLKGTIWWPPANYWDGAIFIYETSEEAPSHDQVFRWLRNFASQGILQRLSGMVIGRPGGEMTDDQREAQYQAIIRVLAESDLANLPVLADMDIGHTDPILTLPMGVFAEIDCEARSLSLVEAAVKAA